MKPKKIQLKHVAEAAGVSLSTASRALSGKAEAYRISPETEQLVQQAAAKLKFKPSQLAQSFRMQRTNLLGIVLPDVSNPFFASIAREVTVKAEQQGYCVLLADSRGSTEQENKLLGQLQARKVEGIVVCPVGLQQKHLEIIESAGTPLVLVDRCFPGSSFVSVTSDHHQGAIEATNLLLQNGHQTIGILQGIPGTSPNEERLTGIRNQLSKHGVSVESENIQGDQFSEQSGYQAAIDLLKKNKQISVLFALSNQIALGALQAARELGLKVPEQLSLITFDDPPYAEFLASPMTTVCQDVNTLGQTAARLMLAQLDSGSKPEKKIHRIPVRLKKRESVAALFEQTKKIHQ